MAAKIDWNPDLHPRDRLGRFRDVFKAILKLNVGDYMDLANVVKDAPNIKNAYAWRTKDGWEIRGTSNSGVFGISVTPEDLAKDEHAFEDVLKAVDMDPPFSDAKKCGCGCFAPVKGNYLPGHDARHKAALVKAALLGDPDSRKILEEKGWMKFLHKTPEKNRPQNLVSTPYENSDTPETSKNVPIPDTVPDLIDQQVATDKTPDKQPTPNDAFSGPDQNLSNEFAGEVPGDFPPPPDDFNDPGPIDDKPVLTPDVAGWEPSEEEYQKAVDQDLKDMAEEEAIDERSITKAVNDLVNAPENYVADQNTETGDEVGKAVDGNTDEYADIIPYPELDTCNCGCGGTKSATAKYLPGHDSRHKSQLVKAALAGDKRAFVTLVQKGWIKFLEKAQGKDISKPKSASVQKQGQESEFTPQELEYDPSRVPAGMPISDDYANYQLLDPGPGTLEQQLERLTARRDAARSAVDRNMLNETLFRMRGGHSATMDVRPSKNKRAVSLFAMDLALLDVGISLGRDVDQFMTPANNIRWATLRHYLTNDDVEKLKGVWTKKQRSEYEARAGKFMDSYDLDRGFAEQSQELNGMFIDGIMHSENIPNRVPYAAIAPIRIWATVQNFNKQVERIKNGELPQGGWHGSNNHLNDYLVQKVVSGQAPDPHFDIVAHVGFGLERVFQELKGKSESQVEDTFKKHNLLWWYKAMTMHDSRHYRTSISMPDLGGNIRSNSPPINQIDILDLVAQLRDGTFKFDHPGFMAALSSQNMFSSLDNNGNPDYAEHRADLFKYMRDWYDNHGGREYAIANPTSRIVQTVKVAQDYQRTKAIGAENTLVSEAPSHDIALEDQIVDENTYRNVLSMDAPDRGKAVFMRDTPLEDDYLMIFGKTQKPMTQEEIDQMEADGNLGNAFFAAGFIDEARQQVVQDAMFEAGAEIKKSVWSLDHMYQGNANAMEVIKNANNMATSIQLDLGDGKLIEFVPDVTGDKTPAADKKAMTNAKQWIADNVGNGPFVLTHVKIADSEGGGRLVVLDRDGNVVWVPSINDPHESELKTKLLNAGAEGKQVMFHADARISRNSLSKKSGALLFRYNRNDGNSSWATAGERTDTQTTLGKSQDETRAALNEALAKHGLTLGRPDNDVDILERNPRPNSTWGANNITYSKFHDMFVSAPATTEGPETTDEASGFKYNIRSQRRQLKFTGMTPKEITDWIGHKLGGSVEPKVPTQQMFGGDRREGRPSILQDAYADGSFKPEFGNAGIVHVAGSGGSTLNDLLSIIQSGGIMSISEKMQRRQWGRHIGGGMSPQGDIGSGIDAFAFANYGQGITYGGGKIRILYRSETAMRRDALVSDRDFGGGKNRYTNYKRYAEQWGGKFGRSVPVENVAGSRVKAPSFMPTSNEFNLKHELPTEDIVAITIPMHWGEDQTMLDRVTAELHKYAPDAKIILSGGGGAYNTGIAEIMQAALEHNKATGFSRDHNNSISTSAYTAKDVSAGDVVVASINNKGNDPIDIIKVENGVITAKLNREQLELIAPGKLEESHAMAQYKYAKMMDVDGKLIEFTLDPNAIRWVRTPLEKMVNA